jgi:hypothetical protein
VKNLFSTLITEGKTFVVYSQTLWQLCRFTLLMVTSTVCFVRIRAKLYILHACKDFPKLAEIHTLGCGLISPGAC